MRINNKQAVGIAIYHTDRQRGRYGQSREKRIQSFSETMPKVLSSTSIYDQGYGVRRGQPRIYLELDHLRRDRSSDLIVLYRFQNGLLIGSGLVFSIFATLIVMFANGIALQRMSLCRYHHRDGYVGR